MQSDPPPTPLPTGDCVSVFAENSANWLLLDQGIIGCGAINAVRGASAPAGELKYIYENSDSVALAVQNHKLLSKLESQIVSAIDLHFSIACGGAVILTYENFRVAKM